MNCKEIICAIQNKKADNGFLRIYDKSELDFQKSRYIDAINNFAKLFGDDREVALYSVSGRSEISGNHTDHNHGKVVAGSISLDIIAVASKNDDTKITIKSEGFDKETIDFATYTKPIEEKFGTSGALVAGMCKGFSNEGYLIGGFDAYMTSNVLKGSGLSSSAAFEDMIGNILNYEYNDGSVDNLEIAKLAQYSENVFFGKPCGLMDQVACALGGIVAIDFFDTKNPIVEKLDFDISKKGYNLCIVDTHGNHADLTDDYASVPAEMKAVASYFGKEYLRLCDQNEVIKAIPTFREKYGDRAIMRAMHFFEENKRVDKIITSLKSNKLEEFFKTIKCSGNSSFKYLQNVYTTKNVAEQGLSLALCLTEQYMQNKDGAFRVHGGGFAGTIQAFVHEKDVDGYKALMDSVFGEGACLVLRVRPYGAVKVF